MSFLTISVASGKTDLHFSGKMIFGWVGVRFLFKESIIKLTIAVYYARWLLSWATSGSRIAALRMPIHSTRSHVMRPLECMIAHGFVYINHTIDETCDRCKRRSTHG